MLNGKGLLAEIENRLGLPNISRISDSLQKFPDTKQLKLIKEVLSLAEEVSKTAPELDKVADLIREINSMPIEKLKELAKVLRSIERIMKQAPEKLLSFITSLKEE